MNRLVLAFTALLMVFSFPVHAQGKIAVANADYIMNEAKAAKDIKAKIKAQKKKIEEDFSATEAILQQEEKSIMQKRSNLTEAEFKKQVTAFRQKMAEEDQRLKRKKGKMDEAFNKALQELQKEVGLVIQEIAREKGFEYVLSKQNVLFAAAGQPDLTQDILERLNQKVTTIPVNISE